MNSTKTQYKIRFSKARQSRGLACFGVFEIMQQGTATEWLRGISSYHTEQEAEAALANLESGQA